MRITFLGKGATGGMPLYGCGCATFAREPCFALIESGTTHILTNIGLMDLHKRLAPGELDAIVLTYFHPDLVQGLFRLRWSKEPSIPVFTPPDSDGCADLFHSHYRFNE